MQSIVNRIGITLTAVTACLGFASYAEAAIVYGGDTSTPTSVLGFTGNGAASSGLGDDYNTGADSVLLTGLTFKGGLNAGTTTDRLAIDFYNTSGVRVASIFPGQSEVSGNSVVHTLDPSNFIQNGVTGVTIPGAGYIVFSPYSFNNANPTPQFYLYGGGALPSVGSNNAALSATTTPNAVTGLPTLTAGKNFYNNAEYAAFTLSGTLVPEPASLGLIGSAAVCVLRRRRTPSIG